MIWNPTAECPSRADRIRSPDDLRRLFTGGLGFHDGAEHMGHERSTP